MVQMQCWRCRHGQLGISIKFAMLIATKQYSGMDHSTQVIVPVKPDVPTRMAGEGGDDGQQAPVGSVATKVKPRAKRPNLYRVLILNDDYTPMEFVVHVLEKFFQKDEEAATKIMLHVHHHGIGECGVFTYEVAETKVTQVMDFARRHQHPLQCVMEKK